MLIAVAVVVAISVDMNKTTSVIAIMTLSTLLLVARVMVYEWNVSILSDVYGFFDALDVTYNRGYAASLSLILGFVYIGMLFWVRLYHRWEITPVEFRHYSLGVVDQSLARGAKTLKTSYPDLFEILLGLSGTLHVYSANGDKELVTIHNVPMLPFLKSRINAILSEAPQVVAVQEEAVNQ